jgi:flagellar protein FlgJ
MNDLSMANLYTDFQGLAKLRQAAREHSPQALRETARQFEGLFLQMMLKSMRNTVSGESLFDSSQTRFYQGIYDQQIALELANSKSIGLAEVLYRQLGGATGASTESQRLIQPHASSRISQAKRTQSAGFNAARVGLNEGYAESPESFIKALWPHAERAGKRLGVAPDVLVAQAALETGWGRHVVQTDRGESSYNLFGIKADSRWQGQRVRASTLEFKEGIAIRNQEMFRAYDSIAAGFDDYVNFLVTNPRYHDALAQAGDSLTYLQELQEDGYATDPRYAEKIRSIMSHDSFGEIVGQLKQS